MYDIDFQLKLLRLSLQMWKLFWSVGIQTLEEANVKMLLIYVIQAHIL